MTKCDDIGSFIQPSYRTCLEALNAGSWPSGFQNVFHLLDCRRCALKDAWRVTSAPSHRPYSTHPVNLFIRSSGRHGSTADRRARWCGCHRCAGGAGFSGSDAKSDRIIDKCCPSRDASGSLYGTPRHWFHDVTGAVLCGVYVSPYCCSLPLSSQLMSYLHTKIFSLVSWTDKIQTEKTKYSTKIN